MLERQPSAVLLVLVKPAILSVDCVIESGTDLALASG